MSKRVLVLAVLTALPGCAGHRPPPRPPLFPLSPLWKTLLTDFVVAPLATDGRRVFVATRDGHVRCLDRDSGEVLWDQGGVPGRLAAAEGTVVVRGEDGTVWSLHPRTGAVRWKTDTRIAGTLPPVLDEDRLYVPGAGLAALDRNDGRVLWSDTSGAETTAPPAPAGARLLAGEADGTLRCRDRATGISLWTLSTGGRLLAPPLVDLPRRKLYLGTTVKQIVEVDLDKGRPGWRWTVGADVAAAGILLDDEVIFASFDAVLWALHRGGNLAWRGALPSRPLSGPLLVRDYLVVACLESDLVAFAPQTHSSAGALRTTAEIRTPPILAGPLLVLGLRDRSVVAYSPPGPGAAPGEPTAVEPPTTGR